MTKYYKPTEHRVMLIDAIIILGFISMCAGILQIIFYDINR